MSRKRRDRTPPDLRSKDQRSSVKDQRSSIKDQRSSWLPYLGLILVSVVPFLPSLNGDFIFDDRKTIEENGVVTGKRPFREILSSDYWGDPLVSSTSHKSFRPLTTLTFWLNYRLHGSWTLGYHLINIGLHLANTVLVYRLIATIVAVSNGIGYGSRKAAWIGAAVFALHPVHVEAVANISGRAELLSCCLFLSTVLLYLDGIVGSEPRKFGTLPRILLHALCVISAVFSKEQSITAPIVCVALEWILYRESLSIGGRIARAMGNAALVVATAVFRHWLNDWTSPRFSRHDNPAAFLQTPLWRLANYAHYWLYSLSLLFLPTRLCFDYSMGTFPPIISIDDYRILSAVGLVAIAITVVVLLATVHEQIRKVLIASIVLTVVTFLPASNLLVTVGFTVAERVLYLPSIGVALLIATVYLSLESRLPRQHLSSAAWTLLALAAAASFQRSADWQSSLSLFTRDVNACPTNAKIHYNLGKVLADLGRTAEAEKRYRTALSLHPTYESALNNLGNLLEASGRAAAAETVLTEAIRVAPGFAAAWMNLGIAQMRGGKMNTSESSLLHSLSLRPLSAEAHFNLGVLYQRQRRVEEARVAWLNATSIDPAHARAWSNLFVLLDDIDRCDEVLILSERALIYHDLASIHSAVGTCLAKRGEFLEAERRLRSAVRLAPRSAVYRANLGVLYQRWHRYDLAIDAYSAALQLDPGIATVRENMEATRRKMNITHF